MGQADMPKVLVMLKQKPLILYLLHELDKIGQLVKPVIVVGYKHNQVKDILGNDYVYGLQAQQLGTAHAVMSAEKAIVADNILVLYGDTPFIKAESLKRLMKLHHDQKSNLSMFTTEVNNFAEYPGMLHFGRIIRDVYGNIIKITEYKDATPAERNIRELNPGMYMFNTKWLFDHIHAIQNKNAQGEYYLTDIVELAIAHGQKISSLAINPKEVFGINSPEDLATAEKMMG